ncbi:MAG TPA: TolC family protein [Elusimicrobiota bacterium]|nr:TolC family protein [Elusimicrobiota bacterium]
MRRRILEVAETLISRHGVDRVSVREIVQKVGVTKPVLYYYFKNKEDVVRHLFKNGAEQFKKLVREAVEEEKTLEGRLTRIFRGHLEYFKAKPHAAQFIFKVLSSAPAAWFHPILYDIKRHHHEAYVRIFGEAARRGEIRPEAVEQGVHLVRGVIAHFIMNLSSESKGHYDGDISRQMAHMICAGAKNMKTLARTATAWIVAGLLAVSASAQPPPDPSPQSLSVEEAVQMALKQNTDVVLAEKNARIFREQVREYWGSVYPEITASANYTRNLKKSVFSVNGNQMVVGTDHTYTGTLEVQQILWAGGKVSTGIRMAKLMSETSAEQLRQAQSGVRRAVRRLYYDLLLASATVVIQQERLDLARQHLSTIQEQYQQGLVSDLILLRQKVEVANTEPALTQARNLYDVGLLELKNLLGLDPEVPLTLTDRLQPLCPDPEDLNGLYLAAHRDRPESRQAVKNYDLAEEQISLARSFLYPNLNAFANKQFQGQTDESRFPNRSERVWPASAGLKLSLPIFSGGATLSKVRQAKLAKEQARASMNETDRSIRIQVKKAWLDLAEARERFSSQKTAVEQARKALKATEVQFRNGLAGQLELNDATLALNQAQIQFVQAEHDVCVASEDLQWAIGQ